jgi:hypothetical protein
VFARATVGNREMRERGELTSAGTEWTKPFHVNDAIDALDALLAQAGHPKGGKEMYDTLSEHSHPNQGAFFRYYRFEEISGGAQVVFLPLPEDYSTPPFPEVELGLMASLHYGALMFEQGGDHEMARLLRLLLEPFHRGR